MSAMREALARDRRMLVERSSICRLRLRREAELVRSLAFPLADLRRTARVIVVAGRIALFAKLAFSIVGLARALARAARGGGSVR